MPRSFVLMTALPPTEGHLDLIRFASFVGGGEATVILSTQPGEPFTEERYDALHKAVRNLPGNIKVFHQHRTLPQEPEGNPGFWDMWRDFLYHYGFHAGDYIVASETYGVKLAEVARGIFIPYDLARGVRWTKGTQVRADWISFWPQMIPEFRKHLVKRVTIFGAESTGKTTLARSLKGAYRPQRSTFLPEWARPFLETVGAELTVAKMDAIHVGQRSLQQATYEAAVKPLVLQDTDLFSTVGYWRNWDSWSVPGTLVRDALRLKSDLYIVTRSNIPFEVDPLRYGGDKRELEDEYWIDLLEEFNLPFVVLDSDNVDERFNQAEGFIDDLMYAEKPLYYQRIGKEYETTV